MSGHPVIGGSEAEIDLAPELDALIAAVHGFHPKSDESVIRRAFDTAELHHRGQFRRSGEPYITHPLAVARILADLGLTTPTIVAALLHDTVEDTPYTIEQLGIDFGDEVAHLVDGVTKLDKVKYGDTSAAETVRKMVVAMARDIRVLVIKLADRVHNMRTLGAMPEHKREAKARETLEIFAPLAHRLGMNTIKFELEDLSFQYLNPKRYEEIVRLVTERAPERQTQLEAVLSEIRTDLDAAHITGATVTGRPKHYYSVYQKMIVRGRDLDDIYDLVGVRVLVETVRDCYAVLGIVHARWSPLPGRFKDYIAMPKFTMYQSLHTTVMGPQGKPVEVQIRTHEMHRQAEYGIAAHWRYKESSKQAPDDFAWLRQLLEWQRETEDPDEFLDSLRFDLAGAEVYVFTPKGAVIALPTGSTPVDFAYSVHTDVGHRCVGARVNGKLVPLESTLNNGDVIEIFTSKAEGAGPSRDWLNFVQSARAKSKIKGWFSKERREEHTEQGKEAIVRGMRKQGLPLQRLMTVQSMSALAVDLRFPDLSALYAAVGEGKIGASTVIQRLVHLQGGEEGALEDLSEATTPEKIRARKGLPQGDPGVEVKGTADVLVKLARCCTPVPGDAIIGYVTRGSGVSVHRHDCPNAIALLAEEDRTVEVAWAARVGSVYLVNIQVEAIDRARLLSDITRALSDQQVNILSAAVTTTRDRVALSKFTFEMSDPRHLSQVLRSVRAIDGVYDCYRI